MGKHIWMLYIHSLQIDQNNFYFYSKKTFCGWPTPLQTHSSTNRIFLEENNIENPYFFLNWKEVIFMTVYSLYYITYGIVACFINLWSCRLYRFEICSYKFFSYLQGRGLSQRRELIPYLPVMMTEKRPITGVQPVFCQMRGVALFLLRMVSN